jgi:hypothetical protein
VEGFHVKGTFTKECVSSRKGFHADKSFTWKIHAGKDFVQTGILCGRGFLPRWVFL